MHISQRVKLCRAGRSADIPELAYVAFADIFYDPCPYSFKRSGAHRFRDRILKNVSACESFKADKLSAGDHIAGGGNRKETPASTAGRNIAH